MKIFARCLALLLLLLSLSATVLAQDAEIEGSFRKVTPEEETRLRAKLAEPAPNTTDKRVLRDHFVAQDSAGVRLADAAARRKVLSEAVERLPDNGC